MVEIGNSSPCISFNLSCSFTLSGIVVALKCKACGMEFESKDRLERHKKVHGRKPKISEAGTFDFNQVGA